MQYHTVSHTILCHIIALFFRVKHSIYLWFLGKAVRNDHILQSMLRFYLLCPLLHSTVDYQIDTWWSFIIPGYFSLICIFILSCSIISVYYEIYIYIYICPCITVQTQNVKFHYFPCLKQHWDLDEFVQDGFTLKTLWWLLIMQPYRRSEPNYFCNWLLNVHACFLPLKMFVFWESYWYTVAPVYMIWLSHSKHNRHYLLPMDSNKEATKSPGPQFTTVTNQFWCRLLQYVALTTLLNTI